eukprot:GCRY01001899.1.p2 GENE.GCRY01001899.1~~GCRY01001899.1.p2  ORF type:complete len:102 (-),score=50.49 GCRY01001899.1:1250-1555(-)
MSSQKRKATSKEILSGKKPRVEDEEEFSGDSSDNEETIEEYEREIEEAEIEEELNALQEDSELSIEELKKKYAALEDFEDEDAEEEEEDEEVEEEEEEEEA